MGYNLWSVGQVVRRISECPQHIHKHPKALADIVMTARHPELVSLLYDVGDMRPVNSVWRPID